MSRRRRAAVLGGLALVLAALAASDVARQESALRRRLGPPVPVLVARTPLPAGRLLSPAALAVRSVPARFAPPDAYSRPAAVAGLRAAVPLRAGSFLVPGAVRGPASVRGASVQAGRGERIVDVAARAAAGQVSPGVRVDVLVTPTTRDGGAGRTVLALRNVLVTATTAAPADQGGDTGAAGPRVQASLLVTLRQALRLATLQSSARELRLLPRPAGER
jgi:pilus assembly protein CpaB